MRLDKETSSQRVQDGENYPGHIKERLDPKGIINSKAFWGKGGIINQLNKVIRSLTKDTWDKTRGEQKSMATA